MTTADDTLLELSGLTKAFPGVIANDGVSFRVRRGEIHALLGEKMYVYENAPGKRIPASRQMLHAHRPLHPS